MPYPRVHEVHSESVAISRFSATFLFFGRGRDPALSRSRFPEADMERRSLLVDQAAEVLGLSRRTVYYRIQEGRLRTIRTRCGSQRVLLDSIEALLREMHARACTRKANRSEAETLAL
jgi:excisionase family DNA binding protein